MGRVRRGRPIDGVLILDKPPGPTSNQALQAVKRLFDAAKAGHTGSLDPLATGVLPICFGEATKFTQFLLEADKIYTATFCLGIATTTGDAQGEELARTPADHLTREMVDAALVQFRGEIVQIPSMYSALKRDGRPLYELARQGLEVERAARTVHVFHYEMETFCGGIHPEITVRIHCSKGTYVRTLAEDLGKVLGCGAHVTQLRRVASGPFGEADAVRLNDLQARREASADVADLQALLKPLDAILSDRRQIELTEGMSWYFLRGQAVAVPETVQSAIGAGEMVRIVRSRGEFLGLGVGTGDGRIKPHRLVRSVAN